MKHRVAFRKLRRTSAHRLSMLRTMVSQLIKHERIETTVQKAKELRRLADKVVTLGKQGDLSARRQASNLVNGEAELHKLFSELAPRYAERQGGYTRIIRTGIRQGDAAQMAFIEYVDRDGELRPARPARSLLPAAAQAAVDAAAAQQR
ncbi:ribosomal L17 [Chlorella sorokiniana]|uniref:Large ribosomal subunit protein bL17c n=1 Tax=Chlorella sorokiniana TaxID=3076 RepID=A0A2P6TYM1_CHLSO|nr:ribosomal L17 [Chlorella sorokiniana]|eukprot:PRW59166.1 ribosomal L17 [Chlorella sorokiniana]